MAFWGGGVGGVGVGVGVGVGGGGIIVYEQKSVKQVTKNILYEKVGGI